MARIDWALLCDVAFMDRLGRLCVIGVTREFFVPTLPIALHQVMLVARLTDMQSVAFSVLATNRPVVTQCH